MPQTFHLGLPFLEAGQAQKHITHNEALRMIDAIVQLSVYAVTATPPASPAEGERHIVAAGATGVFAAKDDKVAIYEDDAWRFLSPRKGWRAWNEDEEVLLLWNGADWAALEAGSGGGFDPDGIDHLFLNDAEPEEPGVVFAMRGEAALLHAIPDAEGGNGDVRLQISKETESDTASVFFATDFSGRAEFGLTGSENFQLKVSADGEDWIEALDIDKHTGRVRLPAVLAPADSAQAVAFRDIREKLSANRTYYVRTDGADSNNGLANTSGGAFLTIQKALVTAAALDCGTYNVTLKVADGAYNAAVQLRDMLGSGSFVLEGNTTTPANVTITLASGNCISASPATPWTVRGFKVSTSAGSGLVSSIPGSKLYYRDIDFGACSLAHLFAIGNGYLHALGGTTIAGNAVVHWLAQAQGQIFDAAITKTLLSLPSFSVFAQANEGGAIKCNNVTFVGSATGARYGVTDISGIFTSGGGANYLPGNTVGTGANYY